MQGPILAGDNTVPATVRDVVTLGDDLHLRLAPDAAPALTLHMKVSRHVAFHRARLGGLAAPGPPDPVGHRHHGPVGRRRRGCAGAGVRRESAL